MQEDCETLPPTDLLARCQTALATGDKPTQYLLARYTGKRVRAADQAARDGQPATSADLTLEQRQELGHVVEELLATVRGPQGKQKAAQAQALLDRTHAPDPRCPRRRSRHAPHDDVDEQEQEPQEHKRGQWSDDVRHEADVRGQDGTKGFRAGRNENFP